MAKYTLYGISSTRSPPSVSAYASYRFPEAVDVPPRFRGGQASLRTEPLFEAAFAELSLCAARPACDTHFLRLGNRLTLKSILQGWSFYFFAFGPEGQQAQWPDSDDNITYAEPAGIYPDRSYAEFGVHICALRSAEFLAATLLHEFAHLAGASGASEADRQRAAERGLSAAEFRRLHLAERAVWACGMRSQYKPNVIGALDRIVGPRIV
jgi:hypothetical protein